MLDTPNPRQIAPCAAWQGKKAEALQLAVRAVDIFAQLNSPNLGSARTILRDMIKHLCSSVSYGGASSLAEMRELFWKDPSTYLIRQSASARRESYER